MEAAQPFDNLGGATAKERVDAAQELDKNCQRFPDEHRKDEADEKLHTRCCLSQRTNVECQAGASLLLGLNRPMCVRCLPRDERWTNSHD